MRLYATISDLIMMYTSLLSHLYNLFSIRWKTVFQYNAYIAFASMMLTPAAYMRHSGRIDRIQKQNSIRILSTINIRAEINQNHQFYHNGSSITIFSLFIDQS